MLSFNNVLSAVRGSKNDTWWPKECAIKRQTDSAECAGRPGEHISERNGAFGGWVPDNIYINTGEC